MRPVLAAALLLTVGLAGCFDDLPLLGPDLPGDYIKDNKYDKWVVEIDHVSGHRPHADAVSLLESRMEALVHKDVVVQVDDVIQTGKSTWSDSAIRSLSGEHRDREHGDGVLVTHVLYLDGSYSKGSVLGLAYGDKELVVLFHDTIERSANLVFTARQIERAVLVHEFGHVLGLVDSGTPMASDHEDDENPGHSSNRDSVMYWAVETTDITRIFTGGIPTEFDRADRADICQAGGRC